MDWLLEQLAKEGAVIKQAPLSFVIVWVLGLIVLYFIMEYIYRQRLAGKDDLISSYREKLGLEPTEKAHPKTSTETSIQQEKDRQLSELQQENDRYKTPKIDILFETTPPYWILEMRQGLGIREQEIYIGVKNSSGVTINNLRVEIEELRVGKETFKQVPLRKIGDTPPYQKEFALHPDEEMLFCVMKLAASDGRITFCPATSELISGTVEETLFPKGYKDVSGNPLPVLTITARGSDTLSCSKQFVLGCWKGQNLTFHLVNKR